MGSKIILILSLCWFTHTLRAQSGCTDPQANNYNPAAVANDGSCTYATTHYTLNLVNNLSDTIQETSGIIDVGNYLYTFNDSGNGPELYELFANGAIHRVIHVQNATNVDWEAITSDANYVYVGDFGNNNGNRQNLCVYRIAKPALLTSLNDTVIADKLSFKWGDQFQFPSNPNANNFDCESFFASSDSLFLFTKNWVDLKTRYYALPNFWVDTAIATLRDSFYVNGLVTDVHFDSINKRVFLLGYKNNGSNFYTSFVYALWDFYPHSYFSGNKRRIEIGNVLTVGQTEGITMSPFAAGYITAEKVSSFVVIPPKLFSYDFSPYFSGDAGIENTKKENRISFFYDSAKAGYTLKINVSFKKARIIDLSGKTLLEIKSTYTEGILSTFHGKAFLILDDESHPLYLP